MEETAKAFLGRGWSFPVRLDESGRIALSEHEDDVREAIRLILLTARGERVMRPEFGAGLRESVFTVINSTNLGALAAEIRRSLVQWEGRIRVLEVTVKPAPGELGKLLVDVDYEVRATRTRFNLVFPFYLETPR